MSCRKDGDRGHVDVPHLSLYSVTYCHITNVLKTEWFQTTSLYDLCVLLRSGICLECGRIKCLCSTCLMGTEPGNREDSEAGGNSAARAGISHLELSAAQGLSWHPGGGFLSTALLASSWHGSWVSREYLQMNRLKPCHLL